MEQFQNFSECLFRNRIEVDPMKSKLVNSSVTFHGEGNILFVEDGVTLERSSITFHGNRSVVYLSKNMHPYLLKISVYHNSTVYFGRDCYFNGIMTVIASELKNVLIGNEGLFSFGIWIRTADPHLLYRIESGKRINPSRSVLVGDHVWLGQQCMLLKGAEIGSGAVIGAGTVCPHKRIPSNTVYAGVPARQVASGVFFSKECTHGWTPEMVDAYMNHPNPTEGGYSNDVNTASDMGCIDYVLQEQPDAEARLQKVQELLIQNQAHNRFYIGPVDEENEREIE